MGRKAERFGGEERGGEGGKKRDLPARLISLIKTLTGTAVGKILLKRTTKETTSSETMRMEISPPIRNMKGDPQCDRSIL